MQKAEIKSLLIFVAWVCWVPEVQAQPVLGMVIEQTKQQRQHLMRPESAGRTLTVEEASASSLALWSIRGVNNHLEAEIWEGDTMHRLPLEIGAKLPSGWQVQAFDVNSVTLKSKQGNRRILAVGAGSTGWEFPQTPRTAVSTSQVSVNPAARTAASNLPSAAMPSATPNVTNSR